MPVDLSDFEPLTEAKPGLDLSDFEPIDLAPPAQSAAPTVELGPQQFTEPFKTVGGVEIGAFREPITQPQEIVLPDAVPTPAGLGPELAPVAGAGTVGELLKTAKEAVSTPPWQGFGVEKIPASIILPGGAAVDLLFNSLGDSKAAQVIQGLHKAGNNQIENMANFMGSPLGVAMMGIGSLGPAAQRIVSLAFAGDMASSQPELWKRFQNATTLREKTETLADAVAGLGLTLTALKHGLTKAEKTTPAEPPPLPSPTPLTDAALGETSPRTQPQLETPNASQITGATSLPQPEVRPPVGGETSLRQQGQAPETRPEVQAEVVPTKEPAPVVQTGEVQAPPQEVAPTVQPPLKEVTPSEKEVQRREGQVAEQSVSEPSVQPAGEKEAVVPSFAKHFDKETFLQQPAWVEPGSALDRVLGELRERNDPFHSIDVQGVWKTLTPAQRQDLAARGWITTNDRNPKVVGLHLSNDAVAARKYFGTQNRIAARQLAESQSKLTAQPAGVPPAAPEAPRPAEAASAGAPPEETYFHGSRNKSLTTIKPTKYGDFGSGVYVGKTAEFSKQFAEGTAFGELSPEERAKGGKIYEVEVVKEPKKVFTEDETPLTGEEIDWWKKTEDGLESDVKTRADLLDEKSGRNYSAFEKTDHQFNSKDWDAFLTKFGYDAVSSGQEMMFRDPTAVRIRRAPAEAIGRPSGVEIIKASEAGKLKDKPYPPNHIVFALRGFPNYETLDTILVPHDGTEAGIKKASEEARRIADDRYEYSHSNSQMAATDELGRAGWVISPNGKIIKAKTPEAQYALGDIDAFKKDRARRAIEARERGDIQGHDAAVQDQFNAELKYARGNLDLLDELRESWAFKKAGISHETIDSRSPDWKDLITQQRRRVEYSVGDQQKLIEKLRDISDRFLTKESRESADKTIASLQSELDNTKTLMASLTDKPQAILDYESDFKPGETLKYDFSKYADPITVTFKRAYDLKGTGFHSGPRAIVDQGGSERTVRLNQLSKPGAPAQPEAAARTTEAPAGNVAEAYPNTPKEIIRKAKSNLESGDLPTELRLYSEEERAGIAKDLGVTDTSPEALSEALIDKFAVNKTETPSPFPKGEVGTEARTDEIDQLVKSEGGIGSEGPGAASAAEKLASYEERKFGKRFVEDKRIAQEIREGTGNRYYEPIPNKVTAEESANLVNQRGIAKSIEDIKDEANGLQPHIRNTMGQVVILRLNEAYRNLKDKAPAEAETILNQATDLAEWQMNYGTRLGQGVQAFAMWARLTPEGKLLSFKRMVKKARDRHRTESQGEVEEIIEGVQAGQAKNAVTRAATKAAETKGIWERYKDQIAGNLAKRLDEASSQSPALQEFSRRLQANIADLVPKPESAKRAALTPAEAFREVVTNWDKYKEAWERTKEEVSKSLSQADEMVMQSVESAMGDLRSAADTRSFGKLLRETLKKHDTEITGLIDKGEIADATNRTITYIEDAIGFKLDSTQRAGIEKSITGQLDQISINRSKAAAERQRKAIEGEANKIAKVLSDTPTFDKTAKNEALALIRAHLKEPQADFVEKIKAFGADENTANSLDRMAAENRRRIELIRELETIGRPEKEAVSIAESMAKDLSDVPTWNDKTPSEVKALIREHSTTGVEDFAVKMKALDITDRTIELVDRIAAENRRRVVAVDRARRVEQLRKQYTRPVAKKIPKELWQRLVELGDANLLNEHSFYDVVSQKLGLPNYDKSTVARLTELANAVRDAAEGVPRDNAMFELNQFIANQKGFSFTDLPIGIYYGNILSGYNTHIVNSLDTFLNVVSEVNGLAATNPRAASQIYAGLFRGLSEGRLDAVNALIEGRMVTDGKWLDAPRLMEVARFGEKGGVPILEGTRMGRLTKRLAESKPAVVLNYWKGVTRALAASDAVMFRGAKEARAALLAFRMAEAEGLKGEAVDARVREILANDKMQDFLDQAKREGLSGREAETHARILREMARDKDLSSDSADFAGEATYNHKPHGMLGYFSEMLGKASESYPVLKLFVPFTRIVANVTNRGLNWTPYGYKRAWKGYSKGEPLTPEQRQQMLFRATAGTAGLVGLGTLHALGVITINGAGPSDREKRRQLKETGWRPYSIRIGDNYYTYTYTPVGLGLSVLGNWFDAVKYHELEQKDAATRAGYAISQIGSTVFSQSFLSGLSKLFQMVSDRSSDSIQAFKQTVSSTAGAMTTPTLFRDIQRLFDPKIYQSNTLMEDLIKNTPFAFLKLKPTLNAFGEPVRPYRNRFIGRISSDPAWKLVAKLGIRIPVPSKSTEIKKDVQMTPQQYYRLQENSGKRIKQWILGGDVDLGSLTNDEAQAVVDSAASAIFKQEANAIREGR